MMRSKLGAVSYSMKNLREVEDLALKHGYSETQQARFPREDLDAEATGIAFHVINPGKRQAFAHRHNQAEEVFVVLSGSGCAKLDDEVVEVGPMDAIRVAPPVARAFEAGPDGLEILVFGPHHAGDAEMLQDPGFWGD
jgi:mannose-6-phosphate isomerase-like protein (cupin superfamily)